MTEATPDRPPRAESLDGAAMVAVVAIVAGVVIGFVGGAFRWCLSRADGLRTELVDWAHRLPGPGWLLPVAVAALGATLAALIVRRVPLAAGSGIPHVEAVSRGSATPPPLLLLPAKFIGGVLAIGSGLVLGREGPTVHMGAVIGAAAARRARLPDSDVRMLQTAVGGAGLAVAFNAPIGGVLFTLEEATKSFRIRTVLTTVVAAATAVGCSRLLIGNHPDFAVEPLAAPSVVVLPLFAVFGLLTGGLGIIYNKLVLIFLDGVAAIPRAPKVVKAAVIGAVIGLLMVVDPMTVGGGDTLTQLIVGGNAIALPVLIGYLLVRFFAGPLSYAAAVPGGLFAPLLAVGALWGVLFVGVLGAVLPNDVSSLLIPMAIVGMGAFFGATVRAPVTGIVLVIEMTATTAVAVPMMVATAAAVLVAEFFRATPIYDSLGERMPAEIAVLTDPVGDRSTGNNRSAVNVEGPVTENAELSPTEWVRDQTERILKQGTTDGVEVADRPIVLFTTTGVKSGKKRYVPLMRVEENGHYAMVASKGGAPEHPSWYFNVRANPAVTVQDGEKVTSGTAREIEGDEREHWWKLAVEAYPPYAEYQTKTDRQIPVFVVE